LCSLRCPERACSLCQPFAFSWTTATCPPRGPPLFCVLTPVYECVKLM
jgi:hypothetical protein